MLHSFYCWGHVGVVLISTVFFSAFGITNWKILAVLWAIVPLVNAAAFTKVPLRSLMEEGETGLSLKELLTMKTFWILLVMMICAGASEQGVSQWASTLAEKGLGITKTAGDLAGPMAFAVLMGASRAFYGKYGDRISLDRFMVLSSLLCIASYLGISLLGMPQLSLVCCALCGLSVGIMWPGTFSKAAAALPKGGTAMFALLALGGDVGCSGGSDSGRICIGVFWRRSEKGHSCRGCFSGVVAARSGAVQTGKRRVKQYHDLCNSCKRGENFFSPLVLSVRVCYHTARSAGMQAFRNKTE